MPDRRHPSRVSTHRLRQDNLQNHPEGQANRQDDQVKTKNNHLAHDAREPMVNPSLGYSPQQVPDYYEPIDSIIYP